MIRKLIPLAVTLVAIGIFAVPQALADSTTGVFALNIDFCSEPCLAGGGSGTVTLTANGSGSTETVTVDVELSGGLDFHQTQGLDAFNFNLSGAPAGTISFKSGSLTTGFVGPVTGGHEDGAGDFNYAVQWGTTFPGTDGTSLIFTIQDSGGGITPAMLEVVSTSPGNGTGNTPVDFAANVTNGVCTGLIGGGNGTSDSTAQTLHSGSTTCSAPPGVPEPTSVLLLGTALAFIGKFLKGRLAVA